jgi:hypothetical protein
VAFTNREGSPVSAPQEIIYWFEQVLVCLASRIEEGVASEEAMAKTVKFGCSEGQREFHGLVLSCWRHCNMLSYMLSDGVAITTSEPQGSRLEA